MIHGLLLAAGASKRLGQAKQLLEIQGKSLLEWSALAMLQTCDEVTIVLGSELIGSQKIIKRLQKDFDNLHVFKCANWEEGMGSSLAAGIQEIGASCHVLVHLVDMPYINGFHLKYLINQFLQNQNLAIVSSFQGQYAPPVLIPQALLYLFREWKGEKGLGAFWKEHPELLKSVELGLPFQDVDTLDDWEKMKKQF